MNAYVVDCSGVRWALPPAESWQMDYTAGVPCDSFWLRCPWDGENPTKPEDWVMFQGEREGERVFTGVVDECEVTITSAGRMLELSGRGMAARLLDNEALSQDYLSATQADILRDHVTPYGVEAAPGGQLPAVSQFSVSTGSSEWSVVYDFARYYGGVSPPLQPDGPAGALPVERRPGAGDRGQRPGHRHHPAGPEVRRAVPGAGAKPVERTGGAGG